MNWRISTNMVSTFLIILVASKKFPYFTFMSWVGLIVDSYEKKNVNDAQTL